MLRGKPVGDSAEKPVHAEPDLESDISAGPTSDDSAVWSENARFGDRQPPHSNTTGRSPPPLPARPQSSGPQDSVDYRPTFYVAGFWRRLVAAGIDLAIILPVATFMAWLAGQLASVHLPASRHWGIDFWLDLILAGDPALIGITVIVLAIASFYVLVFQITLARTLGMRLMKLRIIDQYGDPPSTPRAVARTSGYLASVLTLGLGFVWIGFDSEKRGLHDWIAGTYVVKT